MTQIFFHHRMTRDLFGGFLRRRLLTDFRRGDLFGRCRYPLGSDKAIRLRFKKICVNLWNLWDKIIPRRKDTPWECKKSHRFHRFTQIFLGTFFKSRRFRRWRRFFSSSDDTEFRGGDLFGRCRYPLGSEKAIHLRFKKICVNLWNLWDKNNPTKKNLCKSVKSVGQNNPTKKNLRISVKSAWQK